MNDPLEHNTRENVDRLFSDPNYAKKYISKKRLKFYKDVVELAHQKGVDYDGKVIADFGCATGHLLNYIDNKYTRVNFSMPRRMYGYDQSVVAMKISDSLNFKTPAQFIEVDLYDFPIDMAVPNYHVIFCTQVLEHLEWPEIVLDNIISSLKSEGKAVITVPDGEHDKFYGTQHINKWAIGEWGEFVKKVCDQNDHHFNIDISLFTNRLFTIITRV